MVAQVDQLDLEGVVRCSRPVTQAATRSLNRPSRVVPVMTCNSTSVLLRPRRLGRHGPAGTNGSGQPRY